MIAVKIALGAVLLVLCSCARVTPPAVLSPAVLSPAPTPQWTVHREVYERMARGDGAIEISLSSQRLTLLDSSGHIALSTDCSTGIDGRETPPGSFRIKEMIIDKRSNKYGQYVSKEDGEVIVAKSWEVAEAPPGTEYLGIAMPYWMRLTWDGIGIHVGSFQPGYRSSFGCIRMPAEVQPLVYQKSKTGMSVTITE